jgi:outer membrane protein TolC
LSNTNKAHYEESVVLKEKLRQSGVRENELLTEVQSVQQQIKQVKQELAQSRQQFELTIGQKDKIILSLKN